MNLLDEFEPTLDAGVAGGEAEAAPSPEAPAEGEAAPSSAETGPASAWSPNDPELRSVIATEAAEIADARVQPLLELLGRLAAGGETAPQGFDWGNVDLYGDNPGEQLGSGIAAEVQRALGPINEFIQEVRQSQQTAQQQQEQQAADAAASSWVEEHAADLPDVARKLIQPLARQFFPKYQAIYGFSDRAGDAAFREALETVRQIRSDGSQAAVQHVEHLAAVSGARTEPSHSGGSGVVGFPERPLSDRELVAKYSANAAAIRGH